MTERPAGRLAWCPVCREVDMADGEWRCCWCGVRTLRGKARVSAIPHRSSMTTRLIVEAHRIHAEGLPLTEVVDAIFERTGYTSRPHCMNALRQAFVAMGLPTRSDADSKALEAWRGTWSGPRFYRRPEVKDDLLGLNQSSICRYESGEYPLSVGELDRLLRCLGRRLELRVRPAEVSAANAGISDGGVCDYTDTICPSSRRGHAGHSRPLQER